MTDMTFGRGAQVSTIHPATLILLIITVALLFLLPRKYAVIPILLLIFLTPFGQQIYVAGAHFYVSRILVLCGWIRIVALEISSSRHVMAGGRNAIDTAFAYSALISASAVVLLFQERQMFVYECGVLLDTIGGYFLFRAFIQDETDVYRIIKTFAVIVAILAAAMLIERLSGQNMFSLLGGGAVYEKLRDGLVRSRATFQGPIPAGTFAATLLCLFVGLWRNDKGRFLALVGAIGATVMVITSRSSTPLLAYTGAVVGLLMWPFRCHMRTLRWGIALLLIGLHLSMKAPVWFLINHVDLIAGNSGYHRAIIIDYCVKNIGQWWLIGVKSTGEWGWGLWDQANQFVSVAENGGLAALIAFVLTISRSFGRLGMARRTTVADDRAEWMLWVLGAALFSHVVGFFGISYQDQSTVSWYALLAMISAHTSHSLSERRLVSERSPSVPPADSLFLGHSEPTLALFEPSEARAQVTASTLRDWTATRCTSTPQFKSMWR